MFGSSHFSFWFLVTFGNEIMKMWKNCLHFARQDGQDRENGKKITQLKQPKYPKPKPKEKNIEWTKQ